MDNIFSGDNMKKLLGGAKKMQAEMEDIQKSLQTLRITGSAGAGIVRVTMNGERKVLKVDIGDGRTDDKEMLQDLVAAATNDALQKTEEAIKEKMQSSMAGVLGSYL